MAERIIGGAIEQGLEKIKPPPIAGTPMNIAPLGVLLWEDKEVAPGATMIIDTFGFTYVTLFVEVNRPASISLAEVSRDGVTWRHVGALIKAFDTASSTFLSLNREVETEGVFLYRFLKLRVDSAAHVRITLEATSKLIDLGPVLEDILLTVSGVPPERVREIIREKEIIEKVIPGAVVPPVSPEFKPLVDAIAALQEPLLKELVDMRTLLGDLKMKETILGESIDIHTLLKNRFTNAVAWDHDQKNVTIPGTPLQLPGLVVPDGYALVIEAKSGNAGNIYLGNSKDAAKNTTKRKTLEAKDSTTLEVKKASAVWIDADNAGEGVELWCERLTEV